jgi:hypothetical protein
VDVADDALRGGLAVADGTKYRAANTEAAAAAT